MDSRVDESMKFSAKLDCPLIELCRGQWCLGLILELQHAILKLDRTRLAIRFLLKQKLGQELVHILKKLLKTFVLAFRS